MKEVAGVHFAAAVAAAVAAVSSVPTAV